MENPFWKKFFKDESEPDDKKKKRWVEICICVASNISGNSSFHHIKFSISDNANKSSNFRKFDYDDDDDSFDLDDFFSEFHGNSFNFQGFPPGIMRQFQEIFEAMKDLEVDPENYEQQKSLENKYNEFRQKTDHDLDGKIYADQLDTLLKRISPEHAPKSELKVIAPVKKVKQPDEDKIMDKIHGTFREEVIPPRPTRRAKVQKLPVHPHHFGGIPPYDFPPAQSAPNTHAASRSWGKTVISIRNADGTYETRKVERSPDGQTKTTITKKNQDGTSSTQTIRGDGSGSGNVNTQKTSLPDLSSDEYAERNLVTKNGYKIPCLFWRAAERTLFYSCWRCDDEKNVWKKNKSIERK